MACEGVFVDALELNPEEYKGFKTLRHTEVEPSLPV